MEKPRSVIIARGDACADLYKQIDGIGNISINNSLIDQLIQDGIRDVQNKAEAMIIAKLSEYGFYFETRGDFLKFAKERLTKVSGLDHNSTTWLYLDMYTRDEKAICSFIDEYSSKIEDGKIILTWSQRVVS